MLYLGKLKPGVKESEIIDYVNKRSEKLGALPPTIHNCKIFQKEVEEGEIIEFCGARLTIDKRSSKLLCHRKFWLGPSYARPWNFPDPSEAATLKMASPSNGLSWPRAMTSNVRGSSAPATPKPRPSPPNQQHSHASIITLLLCKLLT